MAVWHPKHENTQIVKLAASNLYDQMPYGGSAGGFYKRSRSPAALPQSGFCNKIPRLFTAPL